MQAHTHVLLAKVGQTTLVTGFHCNGPRVMVWAPKIPHKPYSFKGMYSSLTLLPQLLQWVATHMRVHSLQFERMQKCCMV